MEAAMYTTLIRDRNKLQERPSQALEQAIEKYPYFATARLLLAKKNYSKEVLTAEQPGSDALSIASLYSGNRSRMKHWITESLLIPSKDQWLQNAPAVDVKPIENTETGATSKIGISEVPEVEEIKTDDSDADSDSGSGTPDVIDQDLEDKLKSIRALSEKISEEQAKFFSSSKLTEEAQAHNFELNPDKPVSLHSELPQLGELEPAEVSTSDDSDGHVVSERKFEINDLSGLSAIEISSVEIGEFDTDLSFTLSDFREFEEEYDKEDFSALSQDDDALETNTTAADVNISDAPVSDDAQVDEVQPALDAVDESIQDIEIEESTVNSLEAKTEAIIELDQTKLEQDANVLGTVEPVEGAPIELPKPIASNERDDHHNFSGWLSRLKGELPVVPPIPVERPEKVEAKAPELAEQPKHQKRDFSNLDNLIAKQLERSVGKSEPLKPSKPIEQVESIGDNSESGDFPVTETFARILAAQGKTAQAIVVYERLSLLYPKKSSFFARQIEDLKK